jgi:uncharacterized membrane protein
LLPQAVKIVTIGGPGHEFENDQEVNEGVGADYTQLKQVGAFYTGTYHTNVISLHNSAQDNFLHVLQTADANTTNQMVATALVEAQTGNMTGAFITSSAGQPNAVVLFAKEERVLGTTESITYEVTGQGDSRHFIADLPAHREYEISNNGQLITVQATGDTRTRHAYDRGTASAGTLFFTIPLQGTHRITLTPKGVVPNQPPVVDFTAQPAISSGSFAYSFTANATDPDGMIVSYNWEFGDGTTSILQNPTHTYITAGSYTTKVTVTDNRGAQANATQVIQLNGSDTMPPAKPLKLRRVQQ